MPKSKWSELGKGKHKGKSLPQVLWTDPDWFFWAIEQGDFFAGRLASEADELCQKARNIRIPSAAGGGRLVAEYSAYSSGEYATFELVPASREIHHDSFRTSNIDMRAVRRMKEYDKAGYKLFLHHLKERLFGDGGRRMTRGRCEQFFEDEASFVLPS